MHHRAATDVQAGDWASLDQVGLFARCCCCPCCTSCSCSFLWLLDHHIQQQQSLHKSAPYAAVGMAWQRSMLRRLHHFACRPPLDWGVPAMLPPSSWKAALSLPPAPSSRAPPLATAPRQRQPLLSRWRAQSLRRRSRRMRCCTGEAVTAMKLGWQRLCGRTSWQMVWMQAGQPPFARASCLLPGCPRFDNPMLRVAAAGTAVWTGRSWSGGTLGLWRWSLM